MDFQLTDEQEEIRKQVRALCSRFPDEYWRERDESGEFPWAFYQAIADGGWLGITIPREYGGAGLGITEAALVMQTVAECGGGTQACSAIHLGIFGLEPLIKYGTQAAKDKYLGSHSQGRYPCVVCRDRAGCRHQYDPDQHFCHPERRRVSHQWSEGLYYQGPRVQENAAVDADHPV